MIQIARRQMNESLCRRVERASGDASGGVGRPSPRLTAPAACVHLSDSSPFSVEHVCPGQQARHFRRRHQAHDGTVPGEDRQLVDQVRRERLVRHHFDRVVETADRHNAMFDRPDVGKEPQDIGRGRETGNPPHPQLGRLRQGEADLRFCGVTQTENDGRNGIEFSAVDGQQVVELFSVQEPRFEKQSGAELKSRTALPTGSASMPAGSLNAHGCLP